MAPREAGPVPDTVAGLVLRQAENDDRALVFEGREWSWREVVDGAVRRAALLTGLLDGGGPPHVGVLLENTDEYVELLLGAALAGAVIVGCNLTRRGEELARDVRKTDCQWVLTDREGLPRCDGLDLGAARGRVLAVDDQPYRRRLAAVADAGIPDHLPGADDLELLIFTSGSTGDPKAVRMTQGRAARSATRMPFGPGDVLYCAMPLFHGNALSSSVFPWLAGGSTLVLRRRFSATGFLPDVRASGATFANTVGRAIAHIVATPPTHHDRDHHLAFVLGPETAAPDKEEFTRRFGVPLVEGYGSSEGAIVLHPVGDARPGALGRAPRGSEVAVVDPATGATCPPATFDDHGRLTNPDQAIGELVGKSGASSFEGYYHDPEAEALRVRNGWYWSGDLAYRDEEGIFYFAGRSGDWLRVDSENFTAAPVERILGRMEGVRGVAVYAVPDSRTGDQVMAALELEDGARFDPEAFAGFLAGQPDLGPKWVPRYVRLVDALPLTATHKLDKTPLRNQQWSTDDPLWCREERGHRYLAMGPAEVAALRHQFAANGRANLLAG
jgi:fatty-acyl-CoA synthase